MRRLSMFLTAILLVSSTSLLQAQDLGGEWSAGLRLGGASGVSLKHHFASNRSAFEMIAATSFDKEMKGFTTTFLYQRLAPLSTNEKLAALIGGGMSLNWRNDVKFGVNGMLGFDWRLYKAPVTLQVDWMPTLFFVNDVYFSGINGAFTIRYILNRKK